MGFASRTKKRLELEDDGMPLVVTIRRLSGNTLEAAAEAKQMAFYAQARAAGAETLAALVATPAKAKAEAEADATEKPKLTEKQRRAARYAAYDVRAVVTAGVESIEGEDLPLTSKGKVDVAKAIDQFTLPTRDKVFREIVDLDPLPPVEEEEPEVPKESELSTGS